MPNKYLLNEFGTQRFTGQFILTSEESEAFSEWTVHTFNQWKLFTLELPVINVYNEINEWLGWCIGHPIVDGILEPEKIILKNPVNEIDPYEDFYDRTTGNWILILLGTETKAIYLDPYGSLPAVFSTNEKTIAATPTLIGSENDWDEQLMLELGYPEKINWLPSGLTFKRNVRRLIANHSLNLSDWKISRHWPAPQTDLSIDDDIETPVNNIIAKIENTITAVSNKFPLCLTITAGMDSRMVLACSRNHVEKAEFITFANKQKPVDMIISERLAKQLNLNHKFLNVLEASTEELDRWQFITGKSVSGGIWKIHKTLTQLDPCRVLLTGQSGEVHKGNYWRPGDTSDGKITATELLKRCKFPAHPLLLKATEDWLAELTHLSTFNMLDLVHIEQRMSCWGAIQSYGNSTSAFEIAPLSSRSIFQSMMRFPIWYRKKVQLPYDICKKAWPELLKQPFNEYPGIYGYLNSKVKIVKKMVKTIVR
jgi:hypothetical protein